MTHTTEQERSGMLPCPFCLGHSTLDSNGEKFRVFCWDCKAKSNEFDTWEEAESAWMRRAPSVPTRKQIEQYLYEQGAVTVSRDVAEAAGLARLAGKMQSAPVVKPPTVAQVEEAVGMGAAAWDCIPPQAIIDSVLQLAGHGVTVLHDAEKLRQLNFLLDRLIECAEEAREDCARAKQMMGRGPEKHCVQSALEISHSIKDRLVDVKRLLVAAPQPPEAGHIPDAGKMDTNVRNLMNAALVACPDCGLSGLHACPSASTTAPHCADAVTALEKVLRAVQRHLPPERIGERETIAEIISIVDPWPLGKPPAPWKDHMTAELVGKLTDVARQFHGTQQLRERIAGLVRPVCERIKQLGDDRMPEGDMGNPISASAPAQLPEIDIDTANHAGIRVRGYTQETVRQLLADQQFKLDELAMLTRMVVHAFRKVAPDNKTAAKAVDYLKRKGLQGNPLRSLGIQEQST